MFGTVVCLVPVCPIRSEAAHRSEQVSQLLFGEVADVMESSGDFIKIKARYDGYEGWCQEKQLLQVEHLRESGVAMAGAWVNELQLDGEKMQIPFGSDLSFLQAGSGSVGSKRIDFKGELLHPSETDFSDENINRLSKLHLSTSYLWGGRSVFGIDCSGFTQMVYKCMNQKLPRDAYQQAEQGEVVGSLEKVRPGDLAFFVNDAARVNHVGILFDSNTIIHASGRVRIDRIEPKGIINVETGELTHRLNVIKRMVEV